MNSDRMTIPEYHEYQRTGVDPRKHERASTVDLRDGTEASLQSWVIKIAEANGWKCYHTHDSRKSEKGFPDLIMIRGHELLAVELKSPVGRPTPEQLEWLALFDGVEKVESYLWKPKNLQEIEKRLRGEL